MYIWPFEIPRTKGPATLGLVASPRRAGAGNDQLTGFAGFLKEKLPGHRIVLPSDPGYDAARKTFNARFDHLCPWGIVFCNGEQDVMICLEGIRKFRVPFRVRAGGHSFAGFSSLDDGWVIDVADLNRLQVDVAVLEATVQGGCQMSDLQHALAPSGLQLPLGGPPVGVAGFVQGGGFGATSRTFGMNSDNVLAARVMLADGRVVQASERVNYDLWWALRGGTGGNFGVLMDVRYALHRAPEQHQWSFAWPIHKPADRAIASRALMTLQDEVVRNAGPELNATADMRYWADQNGGTPQMLRLYLWGSFFGSESDMGDLLKPLRALPGNQPFTQFGTKPLPVLRQARFVSELQALDWKALVDDFAEHANRFSTLTLSAWGGAIGAYPRERSAFIHRDAAFNMYVTGFWDGAADEQQMQAYLARWRAFIAPFWTGGIYQDFADSDCPDYRSNYWGDAFAALLAVKRKYDPQGLFAFPQAIVARSGETPAATWPPQVAGWLDKAIEV